MCNTYPGSLHNHTDWSNLRLRDSINTVEGIIDYALKLGHKTIAITEHETVANALKVEKYYNKIKENNPDFKVILGNEIYLCRNGLNSSNFIKGEDHYYHFILLAKDAEGHKQLRQLSSAAWGRSYFTGKMRRVPTYYSDLLEIVGKNSGHIIGSTACLGGFLDIKLIQYREAGEPKEIYDKILNWLREMQKIFGNENFYLELQPSKNADQIYVNKEMLKISKILNIPYIITTDSHYLKKEDASIHEAYLKSQEGDREVRSFYETTYMMGDEELRTFFEYLTEEELQTAYNNILEIKSKCKDYSLKKKLEIPSLLWKEPKIKDIPNHYYDKIPYLKTFMNSEFDGDQVMCQMIVSKLEEDKRLQNKETYDEINDNLRITWISSKVNDAHWSAYFLNLQKIIEVCWEAGTLVGPGRGSGVGFLLLYILDIIQINPMWETTKTYSWRFLNPNRVSVLDIDTDIESGRRGKVLEAFRKVYGKEYVSNVATFGTEGSKQAIQTAARGLGIDVDEAQGISSLIPADRGTVRSLKECYYGDAEKGFKPIPAFIKEMNNRPELWEVAQRIEGLICRIGEHAGGVIFTNKEFYNYTGLMTAPSGDTITQFDLHDCEECSLIKMDLLSVNYLDKIHYCLDLLEEYGHIKNQGSIKKTYDKYLGIYNLERNNKEMWDKVNKHQIQSLFQMEQQSGIQGISLGHPESVDDLAVLNSVIRLMPQSANEERPLEKYSRFKKNISEWYEEMDRYGLTKEEQKIIEPILKISYGMCITQEQFMSLVQIPECGGFDLTWSDRLRKSIAKKSPKAYDELQKEYFEKVADKNLSKNLCNYVWNVLIATNRGYGFNASHTLAYSLVALQEMNLSFLFPEIYWNCACLIANSGGAETDEEGERKSTDYKKMAIAISKTIKSSIKVEPPDINTSKFTFTPDEKENQILFGMSGILNVGEDLINSIIENRPYQSPKDFYARVKPNKQAMIALIKSGAFDKMIDRKICMGWFIWNTCGIKKSVNLRNIRALIKYNLLPLDNEELADKIRVFEFNRYLKEKMHQYQGCYILDNRAINYLTKQDLLDNVEIVENNIYLIDIKVWDKIYQSKMDFLRDWLKENQEEVLQKLNSKLFLLDWNKYALGNFSRWEMETLCFYYHEHELINTNFHKYGIVNYNELPTEPEVDRYFYKDDKKINLYKLNRIAGTCIAKDKNKSIVTLLTVDGVVNVKFRKGLFALYDKQISAVDAEGKKRVLEKSWFNRGNMIVVTGIREGDEDFFAKKYSATPGHTIYKIEEIKDNGDLILLDHRAGEVD